MRRYTIFLRADGSQVACEVLGVTTEIVDMLSAPLPVMVDTVLLPWIGKVISDGMLSAYPVVIGSGIRASLRDAYRRASLEGRVVACVDPQDDIAAPHPKAASRGRSTAVQRLLSRCPPTVEEFKGRYGEPQLEVSNDVGRKYSP